MNRSLVLVMMGALLFAAVIAVFVQSKLSPKNSASAPTSQILVANKRIVTGERLKPEDTRWENWPESAMYNGVYKKKDYPEDLKPDVYNQPVRRAIESGEPVTLQTLIDTKGGNSVLAASIGPGMRAVSLPATISNSVGGFLMPGDYVDIILSYTAPVPSDAQKFSDKIVSRYASQTILGNVRILAVDQNSKQPEKTDAKSSVKTVTVEVTKEGAEIIALSKEMGSLSLALRHIGEQDTPASVVTPITTDATTSEVLLKLNALVEKAKSTSNAVRVYSGNSVTNVPVRTIDAP